MLPARRSSDRGSDPGARRHRLAAATAGTIFAAFQRYNDEFRVITSRAKRRFEDREWKLAQRDAAERIGLYDRSVERCIVDLVRQMGASIACEATWRLARADYAERIEDCADSQFFKTWFNSITRIVFNTNGVNPAIEFVAIGLEPALGRGKPPICREGGEACPALAQRLIDRFERIHGSVDGPAATVRLAAVLANLAGGRGKIIVEMLEPVFYRSTRAFLVGRVAVRDKYSPLVLAFRNDGDSIALDAIITDDNEVRMLFGFSRSYFHADVEPAGATVAFLQTFMPGKPTGELYTVLGRAKQGKTERYRDIYRQLRISRDCFAHADGERGLVMIVFSLPSSNVVFKVIRDKFPAPKLASRTEVMGKYQFVFRHDRVGRLVDAQEFRRLRLPRNRFAATLLEELLSDASRHCRVDGDDVIVEHCYIERRLRPLNLYLREADEAGAIRAAIDYGQAIRDLACTNVFPGDLLLKNFGVSRHGRVIFYDYDELCLVTECRFREIPAARFEEDETRAEPWFHVGPEDVFPEQFIDFLNLRGAARAAFLHHHAELLSAGFWRRIQACHEREQYLEVIPYSAEVAGADRPVRAPYFAVV